MSRTSVKKILQVRALWDVDVQHPRMMRGPGVKRWRVLALPEAGDPPEQVNHRGHLIQVTQAERQKAGVVRKPRQRKKKSGKGSGKGSQPPQPK